MTSLELHGIYHELNFWKGFVKTDRFLNGWVKKVKTPELNNEVADFILSVPHEKVLDVGSGVCSLLNGICNPLTVDPLGDLYKLIFNYENHRLASPLPIPAEEISFKDEFDIVHISNALDHCQSPPDAIERLYDAVKPGGFLIVQGFCDEAVYEQWQGFHQWNLDVDDEGALIMSGKHIVSIYDKVPHKWKKLAINDKEWFYLIIKK